MRSVSPTINIVIFGGKKNYADKQLFMSCGRNVFFFYFFMYNKLDLFLNKIKQAICKAWLCFSMEKTLLDLHRLKYYSTKVIITSSLLKNRPVVSSKNKFSIQTFKI